MSKLVINDSIQIPFDELCFTATRSQGPGGQNVNKVSSKVILQWDFNSSSALPEDVKQRLQRNARGSISKAGVLTLTSQRSRQQPMNREDCLRKLRLMILDAAKLPKRRRSTKPTRSSVQRRRRAKQQASIKKKLRSAPNLDD